MRIAVLANCFPALSEQFVRREVQALAQRGHTVAVFAGYEYERPTGDGVPGVEVHRWDAIVGWRPEVMYAQMGLDAHRRAFAVAQQTNTPFALRIWQGYDSFARPSPEFYAPASRHRLCLAVFVEDEWNREHAAQAMQVEPTRLVVVPNSLDLNRFRPRSHERTQGPVRILAVSRFVPKKGLAYLLRAFTKLAPGSASLHVVGWGPEEKHLRELGGPLVHFEGMATADQIPLVMRGADVYAAPCIKMPDGDADGITTSTLEAMASGLPIVASDLLCASEYVKGCGILVNPGDENDLAMALGALVASEPMRTAMGRNARTFAEQHLDLERNILTIETVLEGGSRACRWAKGLREITEARGRRDRVLRTLYDELTDTALAFWQPQGSVLDVGCGTGWMQERVKRDHPVTDYAGTDVHEHDAPWYTRAKAEALPFESNVYDTVICNSVLQHVETPGNVLGECGRVLKPGGRLCLSVNLANDPNPIFLWWFSTNEVLELVEFAGLHVEKFEEIWDHRVLLVRAMKD